VTAPDVVPKKTSIDKDLRKIGSLEQASRSLTSGLAAPAIALVFLVLAGIFAATQFSGHGAIAILIGAAILGGYMAMNIGANDVANNVGPAVGARAMTLFGALMIAAFFECAGALIAGGDVVSTISKGIIDSKQVPSSQVFIWAMMAALLSSAIWVNLATWLGAPVSTTHSVVGGVLGAGAAAAGFSAVNWPTMGAIAASWVISPVLGGVIAAVFLAFIKTFIIYQEDKIGQAKKWVPMLIAIMAGCFAAYLAMKGLKKIWKVSLLSAVSFGFLTMLDRPFKVRRLGHFGYSCKNLAACLEFYNQDIGFKVSDPLDFATLSPALGELLKDIEDTNLYFMRHGTDHHSFVLADREAVDRMYASRPHRPSHSVNQMTWQVGSLREVVNAIDYFEATGVPINRAGRDMPGSNWHVYPFDPEFHRNELYYGMEQVGWNGIPKPVELYARGFHDKPDLPQISEEEEVLRAIADGVDMNTGYVQREIMESTYDVDGVLLPRPFKVVRHGPIGLFIDDIDAASDFYQNIMGFIVTREITYKGERCQFLRCNTEHHSLALYSKKLRTELGSAEDSSCMGFGVQMGNYRQLQDAVTFLKERGREIVELPGELFPGMDYVAAVTDPDGVRLILYHYMEQVPGNVSWLNDTSIANTAIASWPKTIEAQADTFMGEAYLGPWG
jgi:phosphate/sulfate permease